MTARNPSAPAVACTSDRSPPDLTSVTLLITKPAIATRFGAVCVKQLNSLIPVRYNTHSCLACKTPFPASHAPYSSEPVARFPVGTQHQQHTYKKKEKKRTQTTTAHKQHPKTKMLMTTTMKTTMKTPLKTTTQRADDDDDNADTDNAAVDADYYIHKGHHHSI